MLTFLFLGSLLTFAAAERKSYEGYKVIEARPYTSEQSKALYQWSLEDVNLDFLTHPRPTYTPVKILVPPQWVEDTQNRLTSLRVQHDILDYDIQRELDTLWAELDSRPANMAVNLSTWNPLSEIMLWMDEVAADCQSSNGATCQTYTGYYSYEGRPIKVLKMSKPGANRKAFYIDATTHAREWITVATLLNIINKLIYEYDSDPVVQRLVDTYDWYFLPVVNPDGYEYTWTDDRMWRKNRNSDDGVCVGIDLNRNYDFKWGTDGTSKNPCSDVYCGVAGLSELETQAVAAEGSRLASSLRAYISLHCNGKLWMHPWGTLVNHTGSEPEDCEVAVDEADLIAVSNAAADAVQNTYNTSWPRGNSCQVIYATSGTTGDYMKGVAGVKYSFTLELREETHIQPDAFIQPSYREVWNGVVAMVDKIEEMHGPDFP